MLEFAKRHSENKRKLTDLIKTTVSDLEYPVWPAGKAPWAIEKGGSGIAPAAPSRKRSSGSPIRDIKPAVGPSKLYLPSDEELANMSSEDAHKMIAVGRELIELAVNSKFSGLNPRSKNMLLTTIDTILLRHNIK